MAGEAFAPFVSLFGVLVLIAAIGWMISPGFRSRVRRITMSWLFLLALAIVALGLLSYDWT